MKDRVTAEFEKMKSVKTKEELYFVFFRLVQIFSLVSIVYLLLYVLPMFMGIRDQDGMAYFGPAFLAAPLALCASQIVLAEASLRAVRKGLPWGTWIGLALSALMISRWYFPLAAFGFYCFLNAGYQRKYLRNSPEIFRELLSSLNMNWIDSGSSTAPELPESQKS